MRYSLKAKAEIWVMAGGKNPALPLSYPKFWSK